MTKDYTPQEILALPMEENDAGAATIGQYLVTLANNVWLEGEGFSGKRPFGNSGWKADIWKALIRAEAVTGALDEYGYVDSVADADVDALMMKVFGQMFKSDFSIPPEPKDWYVVHLGLNNSDLPEIVDYFGEPYTENRAKELAKELNDEVPGHDWFAHRIPKES